MKQNYILSAFAVSLLSYTVMAQNPLLEAFDTPFQTPPFDKIKTEHYLPAFEQAIEEARNEIDLIIANEEAPNFENTIEALEFAGRRLNMIQNIFFNLNNAATSDEMQQVALKVSPLITEFGNDISLNERLFAKVKTVYVDRDNFFLDKEQRRLLEKTYKSFTRSGADLTGKDKENYRAITKELSNLSLQFNQNLLAATNAFVLHLTDVADIEGLPSFVLDMGEAEAKNRGLDGWVFTLQAPSMQPFMKYSKKRGLREKMWKAYNSRCFADDSMSNKEIIKRITDLRLQKARLLGYDTHADYVLEERMAKNIPTVNGFLEQLLDKSISYAREEVAEIQEYARKKGFDQELMPWDFGYYSDKLKDEKYTLNDELLKPYFKLENLEKGIFILANKLYGLSFKENSEIPVYHPDVKVYEVYDETGKFLAVLYMDYFPRESKLGGAWMTVFREQGIYGGKEFRPFVSVVTNFTKPTPGKPSLLTFEEVTTLLHEFGHALHGMLSEGRYPSVTGTNVAWDFVELPSQIMENWATEKEFLALWANHYQTGEVIPDELIEKIKSAKNFLSAYANVRQLSFGMDDMAWHTIRQPVTEPVELFERHATEKTQLLPVIDNTCFSTSFGHIFAGGYSAGYYSYKWAEVLEADAFSLFKEKGGFDREVADSFRKNVLSQGDKDDAMTLFVNFRGHEPRVDALLEKLGLK
ncbi:MAG TPA: M3 family metallopeptidase [Candidatus Avirikenella pullistercoris]|nr:M3 family metallopeptidase [Candidatus Avirikenella pullistercoris]